MRLNKPCTKRIRSINDNINVTKINNMNIELYKISGDYFYFDEDTRTEGVMYVEEHEHMGEKYIEVVSYDHYDPITEKVDAYIQKYPDVLTNIKEL